MGLRNGEVTLANNHFQWLEMFNREKLILKDIFGELAIEIEHIGSTSINGLLAKPIVDIAIAVNDLNDVEIIKDKLELIYKLKSDVNLEEILLIKEDSQNTYFLIHIMRIDSQRYKDAIDFRDYIRENNEALKQYETLKIELAKQYPNDRATYTKSKNNFIKEVLRKIKRY